MVSKDGRRRRGGCDLDGQERIGISLNASRVGQSHGECVEAVVVVWQPCLLGWLCEAQHDNSNGRPRRRVVVRISLFWSLPLPSHLPHWRWFCPSSTQRRIFSVSLEKLLFPEPSQRDRKRNAAW